MAKKRYLNTKFWVDDYVVELDPTEKLLFLYLLTNQYTNICGVYELSLASMSFDTGIEKTMIKKILMRFEADNKAVYRNGWIYIKNFIKHQELNPSIKRGIEKSIKELPQNVKETFQIGDTSLLQSDTSLIQSEPYFNSNINKRNAFNIKLIINYGLSKGYSKEVCERFYNHYSKNNWKTKNGIKINDWKSKLDYWVNNDFNYSLNNNEDEYTENKWAN